MDSLYFGLTIIAIFVIVFWYIKNERQSPQEAGIGLLATRDPAALAAAAALRRQKKAPFKIPGHEANKEHDAPQE
jgi:hypothetical protein